MSIAARIVLAPVRVYQRMISPLLPRRCKYHPTCSAYAVQAIRRFGILRGSVLAGWRRAALQPVEPRRATTPSRPRPCSARPARPTASLRQTPSTVYHVFGNVLQPLIDFFEAILKFFHDSVGLGWGLSIVALTVLVRACLLPLTLKQFKSMQSLAKHQPEIKKLQEKYKNDKERLNQEMMKFYRENKVNPFASCLPIVAQLPVFLALFYMLQADLRRDICPDVNPPSVADPQPCGPGGDGAFLFIPDLTNRATGWVLVVADRRSTSARSCCRRCSCRPRPIARSG